REAGDSDGRVQRAERDELGDAAVERYGVGLREDEYAVVGVFGTAVAVLGAFGLLGKNVGRTPSSAAGPLAGPVRSADAWSLERRAGRGVPRRPGGLPHSRCTLIIHRCMVLGRAGFVLLCTASYSYTVRANCLPISCTLTMRPALAFM